MIRFIFRESNPFFFFSFLARLYESTGSYCCHFDVCVGVGVGVGVAVGVGVTLKVLRKSFQTFISQLPLTRTISYLKHYTPESDPGVGLRGKKLDHTHFKVL